MAKSRQKRLDKLERLTPPSDNLQAHFNFPYLELLSSATLRVKKLWWFVGSSKIKKLLGFNSNKHSLTLVCSPPLNNFIGLSVLAALIPARAKRCRIVAGYSAVYIHRAEEKNALKVERQAKLDKQEEKRKKELLREQKKHMQTPIDWQKPSETLPYPEVSQADPFLTN